MAKVKYTNNAETTLAAGIGTGDASLTVVSAAAFPVLSGGDWFYATLSEGGTIEIVKVTATSGTTFTITRAQDGTSAASFTTAAKVALRVVRKLLDELVASKATILETARNIAIGTDATGSATFDGSGDITINITIANNAVTLGKMAQVATQTFLGRTTAATGNVEALTVAQAKTMLNLTGTNSGDQTITLTGDVTGSGTASFAATIANSAVTLAKMADVATSTVFYRKTAGTGAPEVQTLATLKTDLGLTGTNSGDQTSIVGISGTLAQFNTALSDADFATGGGTATGTNTGDQTITLTGDVTGSGTGSFAATIAANAVTLAKFQQVATGTVLGRTTAATGNIEVLTTLPTAVMPAFSGGDVTSSAGSLTLTIANSAVTLAKMANMATASVFYRKTAGTGAPEVQTLATLKTDLGLTGTNSGDQTSIVGITGTIAQFNTACTDADFATGGGTATGTNTGDQTITLTGNVTGSGTGSFATTIASNAVTLAMMADIATASFLGRNTAATGDPEVLSIATAKTMLNLTGTNSGDQTITLTGDVTGSGTASFAATIAANAVTLAKFQQIATSSFLGRVTAATGNAEVLTGTQATTLLDVFTSGLKGLAPASGGGTTNFLRADGTWAAPPGGSSDHGTLTGLGDDDHPQYPLAAGNETISGTWLHTSTMAISLTQGHGQSRHFELNTTEGAAAEAIDLMFHQTNRWYNRIRGVSGGFEFISGGSTALVPITASRLYTSINGAGYVMKDSAGTGSAMNAYLSYQSSDGTERGWVGFGSGTTEMRLQNNIGVLTLSSTGGVYISGGYLYNDSGWMRLANSGTTGLYLTSGAYFYSDQSQWFLRSNSNASTSLYLQFTNATNVGRIYADGGAQGFLNSTGGWAFRVNWSGNYAFCYTPLASSASSTTVTAQNSALVAREYAYGGAQTANYSYAPRIGLHWEGRVARNIGLHSDGTIEILDDTTSAYTPLRSGRHYTNNWFAAESGSGIYFTGGQVYTELAGNAVTYGTLSISGSQNSYAGIDFLGSYQSRHFMLNTGSGLHGVWNATTSWDWYWDPAVGTFRASGSHIVWHANNDGAGSGLDADLLDGQQGSYYLAASSYTASDVLSKMLTVDGSGSGLDADLLDGNNSSAFILAGGVAKIFVQSGQPTATASGDLWLW